MVLKPSVAWLCCASGSEGECSYCHHMGRLRNKSCKYGQGYCKKTKPSLWSTLQQLEWMNVWLQLRLLSNTLNLAVPYLWVYIEATMTNLFMQYNAANKRQKKIGTKV